MTSFDVRELAEEIDDFYYDFDTYDYNDNYDDRESGLADAEEMLVSGHTAELVHFFNSILDDEMEADYWDEAEYLRDRLVLFQVERCAA